VKITQSGLWLAQHLHTPGLTEESIAQIETLFTSKYAKLVAG
jgi:hypothetical protein